MSTVNTTIHIRHPDAERNEEALWNLFMLIFDWVKEMHPEITETDDSEVGRYYLKSLALHSGAIPDVDALGTYGYIKRWSYSPARFVLEINQTTFEWQEAVVMWELIAGKYCPGAVVTYKSVCETSNDFSTNIAEYADSYVIKAKGKYIEKATKEEVESILSKRYKGSFNEMYASYRNKRPSNFTIAKWDIVPIEETV